MKEIGRYFSRKYRARKIADRSAHCYLGKFPRTLAPRGFTLLELLVVMGVIAVLAGLTAAALTSTVERGRQVQCMNNMRQIGLGIVNCSRDSDDLQLPKIYDIQVQGSGKYKLFAKFQHTPSDILNFVDVSLLQCPTDRTPVPFDATSGTGAPIIVPCSYGFNFVPAIAGVRLSTLDPRTFLVFDGQCSKTAQTSHWTGTASDVTRFATDLGSPRHGGKFLVYFVDGHCELLSTLPASGVLP